MHRIDTPTAQTDKFGQGKNGFTNGDPSTGRRATDLNSDMWDAVQEEICTVIERAGIALDKAQHDQLYEAIVGLITDSVPDALLRKNNLSDVIDKAVARQNLELKNAAQRDVQESRDDTTPGRVLVNGGALALRSVAASADRDIKDANDLPANSVSFCYASAANSPGYDATIIDVAGLGGDVYRVQYAASYSDGGRQLKFRTMNAEGRWGAWANVITSYGGTIGGTLRVDAEIQTTSSNSFRMVSGDYGTFWRQDGNTLYLMLTNPGDQYGSYNDFRPLIVDLRTGAVTLPGGTSANGLFYAGELNVGAARFTNDGNAFGAIWGGDWLSNYINSRLAKNPNVVGVGGVGTYAFCTYKYAAISPNQLVSGGDLFISGVGAQKSSSGWGDKSLIIDQAGTLSGTWMCCGAQPGPDGSDIGATLYYRIA